MKHALVALGGVAVGLPVLAAFASMNGHTAGGLPDRYVPWVRAVHRIHRPFATVTATASASARLPAPVPRRMRPSPPRATVRPPARPPARPAPARHAPATADLWLSISAPRTVEPGGRYSYQVVLANRGPGTPTAVTVRNLLPAGVTRVGAALPKGVGGYAGGREAALVLRRLEPGRSIAARFDVRVEPRTRGELVARSAIAYVGGVRDQRRHDNAARVVTRVLPPARYR